MIYTTKRINVDLNKNEAYLLYDSNKESLSFGNQLCLYCNNLSDKSNNIKLLVDNNVLSATIPKRSNNQLMFWFWVDDDTKSIWIVNQKKCKIFGHWIVIKKQ